MTYDPFHSGRRSTQSTSDERVHKRPTVSRRSIHDAGARFIVGLDLGQIRDYSAIVIVERIRQRFDSANDDDHIQYRPGDLHLRHLKRFPLGTPYPTIVDNVTQ